MTLSINLVFDELAGGHTILRHVGQTEELLRQRLADFPKLRDASSFKDLGEAESAIGAAIKSNCATIIAWLATYGAPGVPSDLVLNHVSPQPVGWHVARSTGALVSSPLVRVVLRVMKSLPNGFFVLTAFPVL